jgi:hypothetical protein
MNDAKYIGLDIHHGPTKQRWAIDFVSGDPSNRYAN